MLALTKERGANLEYFGSPLPRNREFYTNYIDYKASAFRTTKEEAVFEYKARAVFDPRLKRYRCPPGTRFGGRITNRLGVGCGGNLVRRLLGQGRRLGHIVDKPGKPSARTSEVRRAGRRGRAATGAAAGAAARTVGAVNRARHLASGQDIVDTRPGDHPYLSSPIRKERFSHLDIFGRALARLAKGLDISDEELTDIADKTNIPVEDLTPERRERLGRMGERINELLNNWADRVDVNLEEVTGLAERTEGAVVEDLGRVRRNRRERRGIAQRERQINRRRRLDQFAERIDIGEDLSNLPGREGDYLTTGGRMANPERRRINTAFIKVVNDVKFNDKKRERLEQAAEQEYIGLQGFWSRRLGRRDFTLKDINLHIRNQEKKPEDEASPESLKALRNDWAELRPFFDPIDDNPPDFDELKSALARLDEDRKQRILKTADLGQTEARIEDQIQAQNALEEAALAEIRKEARYIHQWEEALKRGNFNEDARQKLLALHGDLARREDTLRLRKEQVERNLAQFLKEGRDDPEEKKRLEGVVRLATIQHAGIIGNRQNITDLRAKYPQLDHQIRQADIKNELPIRIGEVPAEGFQVFGTPGTKPTFMGAIGAQDENGIPYVRNIRNPDITSKEAAVTHVKNGGSLGDVPNEFWHAAILENSSEDEIDKSTKFQMIQASNGVQGNTIIYRARNEDGTVSNKGWVMKQMNGEYSAIREQAGWAVLNLAGIMPDVAGLDGKEELRGTQRHNVVLPFAGNMAPNGEFVFDQGRDFNVGRLQIETSDRAAPQRLGNILGNFLAAAGDRHDGNAKSFQVEGDFYVAPLDMGMAMDMQRGEVRETLDEYLRWFSMDTFFVEDIQDHLGSLKNEKQAVEQAQAIIDTYDKIVANTQRLKKIDADQFAAHLAGEGAIDRVHQEAYDIVLAQLDKLEKSREKFLGDLIPDNIMAQVKEARQIEAQKAIDEARAVQNAADRQSQWVGNILVPDAEAKIDFSINTPLKAAEHVRNGGDIAVLPDQVYAYGMLGAGLLVDTNGKNIDVDDFLNLIEEPRRMSNEVFEFNRIKAEGRGDFVYQVVTKGDPEKVYFMKTGKYGEHEAMYEAVGAELARVMGFDNDDKAGAVRVTSSIEGKEGQRWTIAPHIANYNQAEGHREKWKVADEVDYDGLLNVNDLAKLGVLDYLANNQDRHHRNLLMTRVGDEFRLVPIDHGLIGFARDSGTSSGVNLSDKTQRWADISPEKFAQKATNNVFDWFIRTTPGDIRGFYRPAGTTAQKRTELLNRMEQVIRQVKNVNVDELFDPERIGRKGIDWTPSEIQHMEAVKTMFTARLERLKDNARMLMGNAVR